MIVMRKYITSLSQVYLATIVPITVVIILHSELMSLIILPIILTIITVVILPVCLLISLVNLKVSKIQLKPLYYTVIAIYVLLVFLTANTILTLSSDNDAEDYSSIKAKNSSLTSDVADARMILSTTGSRIERS